MSSSKLPTTASSTATTIRIEPGQEFVSEFIYALGALTDRDPEDIPPLHETIDTDVLEALFSPTESSATRFAGTLSFPFESGIVYLEAQPHTATAEGQQVVQLSITDQ